MMQYDAGHGDYTVERAHLLAGLTLEEAIAELRTRGEPPEGS
jgi:hypothetical protein